MTPARHVDRAGCWAAAALGCSIPISVALDNVLIAVCLAAWLAGGSWREKLRILRGNPVAHAALALFALLAAGLAWGVRDPGDGILYLGKYDDLLFVAPLLCLLRDATVRSWAIRAFAASLGIVLLISFTIKAGLLPPGRWLLGNPADPVAFKHYLTHNVLMSYGAFLFAELALAARTTRGRVLLAAASVLAAINVLFMVPGRTGYLVLGVLALYFGYRLRGRSGLALGAAAVVAVAFTLALVPGPFQQRLQALASEYRAWQPGQHEVVTSTGLRLEFYRNSLAIIRDHPVFGVGTGGFPRAYAERARGTGVAESRNPHNEYLLITVQVGIAGLAALLWLFCVQWRAAPRLASPLETHLARGLVLTIAVGCLFNSLLLDHTEGLLYAWLTSVLYAGLQSQRDG